MFRILVVDDEEDVRTFVADALQTDGYEVVQAGDGAEAAALIDSQSFHLVVTDLRMPRMDGMALLRKIRADQPEVEVVVLTAHGSIDGAVEAMRLGAFEYLQKPISGPAELRLLAGRALERRSLLDGREVQRRLRDEPEIRLAHRAAAMTDVEAALRKVARTMSTVLLQGESGTGKEVAARAVHAWSPRHDGPFVAMNCAALPESLLESELFGHEKGAFTGASERRRGRIELADGGTLFLDEVGELKPELQATLLRVLEERSFHRLGGTRTIRVDVRWVAATNRDLHAMMEAGTFREDLYHRLAVFPVRLPPLRERREDILPLVEALLPRIAAEMGVRRPDLSDAAAEVIASAPWPGNVRELANALERAVILCDGPLIEPRHLVLDRPVARAGGLENRTLAELEREAVERALAACGGNRRQAAERLGIGLRTLYDKLKRYGME